MDKNKIMALNDERNMKQLDRKSKVFSYSFFTTEQTTNLNVNLPAQWFIDGRSTQKIDVKLECIVSNDYNKINLADDTPYLVYINGFSSFGRTTNDAITDGRPYFCIVRSQVSQHSSSNFYIDYHNSGNQFINTFDMPQQVQLQLEIISGALGNFPFPAQTGFWGSISFELSD